LYVQIKFISGDFFSGLVFEPRIFGSELLTDFNPFQMEEDNLRTLCTDPDPRVRATAIRDLEQLCMRNRGILSMDSYTTVRDLCGNSSVNVRLCALRIIEQLAQHYPEL
jgi:hypothetical protein